MNLPRPPHDHPNDIKSYGQIAYEAYCVKSDHKSLISGSPLPTWDELAAPIRYCWEYAAAAVSKEIHRIN
jgi:alpha-D-ribose 1-methylphosphonate 5-phosphate C-P lyase